MPPSLPKPRIPREAPTPGAGLPGEDGSRDLHATSFHQAFGPGECHPAGFQEASSFVFDFAQDGGSWVDPLFRGLPPIQDLPSLGKRYLDLEFLGEGATAKVFKAMDSLLLRHVALKILKDPSAPVLVEGRAQARIEHPNVCRVYEVGHGYLVMELIEGATLLQLAPSLDLAGKVRIVRDVAQGAHAAHQRDLVHLDLKLGNVLVRTGEDGAHHPLIGDFGMVLGRAGPGAPPCPLGTPPFSSPEQLRGDPGGVDRRSDIYSLGVVLYVLLSGASPFPGRDRQALLEAIGHVDPVPLRTRAPRVPSDLAGIVGRCMEKDPALRYATALQLAQDLDRFLQEEAVAAMRPSWIYLGRKWFRRNRRLTAIGALCAALLLATGFVAVRHGRFVVEQEEWDHHFQVILEDLRSRLDRSYRKPIHDVEPELSEAQNAIVQIESEMRQSRAAKGPGHLALGQAKLLLDGRSAGALQDLETAWDGGFRTESARAWLAYVLVTRYREAYARFSRWTPRSLTEPAPPPKPDPHLLMRARQLLAGRKNTEQRRIVHLLEVADLAASDVKEGNRALQVARAFRAQFPDDINGMLEESQVLVDTAASLWRCPVEPGSGQAGGAQQVAPLLEEANQVLLRALGHAPSHPEVYRRLGKLCLLRGECAGPESPEGPRLRVEARSWLQAGLRVAPSNGATFNEYIEVLLRPAEDRSRSDPTRARSWRALQNEWSRAASSRNPWFLDFLLAGTVEHLATTEPGAETTLTRVRQFLGHWSRLPASGQSASIPGRQFPLFATSLGEIILNAGGNPAILQPFAPELFAAGGAPAEWVPRFRLLLAQAEYRRLTREDARPVLEAAWETFASRKPNPGRDPIYELQLRTLQARITGHPAVRENLRGLLRSLGGPRQDPSRAYIDLGVADALLTLARAEQEEGGDSRPSLASARVILAGSSWLPDPPSPMIRGLRAELCLLEGRTLADRAEAHRKYQDGLQEATLALAPPSPRHRWTEEDINIRILGGLPVQRGRAIGARIELCLALGEAEASVQARAALGRTALAALAEARRTRPLEARALRPLERRALDLCRPRMVTAIRPSAEAGPGAAAASAERAGR